MSDAGGASAAVPRGSGEAMPSPQTISLLIKNPSSSSPGDFILANVSPLATVLDVKQRLQKEYPGHPEPHRQKLIVAGQMAKDSGPLLEMFKYRDWSEPQVMHLVVSAPMGSSATSTGAHTTYAARPPSSTHPSQTAPVPASASPSTLSSSTPSSFASASSVAPSNKNAQERSSGGSSSSSALASTLTTGPFPTWSGSGEGGSQPVPTTGDLGLSQSSSHPTAFQQAAPSIVPEAAAAQPPNGAAPFGAFPMMPSPVFGAGLPGLGAFPPNPFMLGMFPPPLGLPANPLLQQQQQQEMQLQQLQAALLGNPMLGMPPFFPGLQMPGLPGLPYYPDLMFSPMGMPGGVLPFGQLAPQGAAGVAQPGAAPQPVHPLQAAAYPLQPNAFVLGADGGLHAPAAPAAQAAAAAQAGPFRRLLRPQALLRPWDRAAPAGGRAQAEGQQLPLGAGGLQPQAQQPGQAAVVGERRIQVALRIDLMLILKLGLMVFLFGQDGSYQRLALLTVFAIVIYLYQTGILSPVMRWLSNQAQRALGPPQLQNGARPPPAPGAPLARADAAGGAQPRPAAGVANQGAPAVGGGGAQEGAGRDQEQMGLLSRILWEIQVFVLGFVTSLLPGFQPPEAPRRRAVHVANQQGDAREGNEQPAQAHAHAE